VLRQENEHHHQEGHDERPNEGRQDKLIDLFQSAGFAAKILKNDAKGAAVDLPLMIAFTPSGCGVRSKNAAGKMICEVEPPSAFSADMNPTL
jgi:hypothetical protein